MANNWGISREVELLVEARDTNFMDESGDHGLTTISPDFPYFYSAVY